MVNYIKTNSRRIIAVVCALLVFIICSTLLFTDGGRGLSNNGDFYRVMDANGLQMADSTDNRYVFKRYYTMDIDEDNITSSLFATVEGEYLYKSPHFVFIKASKFLNYISNIITDAPAQHYDIFYLAALYIAILAYGAYLIVYFFKKPVHQVIASALFIIMFCDAGHLLYFNSLYGEGLQFVTLTLIVGIILSFIDKRINKANIAIILLSIYFFAGSKLANIPLALLTTAVLFVFILNMKKAHKLTLSVGAAILAVSLSVMYVSIPSWMNEQTTYQTVFYGILKESTTVEEDLSELGLPQEYKSLANTHAYMGEYPIDITSEEFRSDFYDKIGKLDAVLFYAKHPVRFIKKAAMAVRESVAIRPVYLGSSPDTRMGQTDKFSLWSNLRGGESIFTNPYIVLPVLFIFAIISLVLTVYLIINKKYSKPLQVWLMLLLLACGIWANILLPVAGNGEADLLKHMYLFIHLTDIALFIFIMAAVTLIPVTKKSVCITVGALAVVSLLNIPTDKETITFGTYNGEPIQWQVMSKMDNNLTLISKDVLFEAPFDTDGEFGSNLWTESDIKDYLNGDFLKEFTQDELARIRPTVHEVTLSQNNSHLAEFGQHSPFWRASRVKSADMQGATYRILAEDKVTLPVLYSYAKGEFDKADKAFYTTDPYGASDSMVRYIDKNGVPVYCDASQSLGIRPVITIERE